MSSRFVVDTNVPIVANGARKGTTSDGPKPSLGCRLAAVSFLERLVKRGLVILDLAGEIQGEYHRYLNPRGQPGVGDRFYQLILNSAPSRVERIELSKTENEFDDFPKSPDLENFDRSDRKFVAAAVKGKGVVANATDGDWLEHEEALRNNRLKLKFVCGLDRVRWFEEGGCAGR